MRNFDVAIIGGGASGCALAVRLAQLNCQKKVILIEKADRLGKKLSATGNGQGNISNSNMSAEHYFGSGARFASALACRDYKSAESLFSGLFCEDEVGRVYPSGKQASSLTDSLLYDLKRSNVEILTGDGVTDIEKGFVITLNSGEKISTKYAVLCVGGKAQKQFKTDGSAYALAQKFGHKLTALYPSLVQLKTDTTHIKTLKGIRVDCIAHAVCGEKILKSMRGDVIFTDYGLSGNAIFSLSPYVVDRQNCKIVLEFLPDIDKSEIESVVNKRKSLGYEDSELLGGTLHNQLGRAIIKRSGSNAKNIANCVKSFSINVLGSLGFDYAQVTRGGVDCTEIKDNLESKIVDNLFFAGEVLDVDGDCGGYNLHWAFTSGMAVAEELMKRL